MGADELRCLSHLLVTVFLYVFAGTMSLPAITDVTMSALCPCEEECSLAIFLSGFQQSVIGVGTVVTTPVVGNLSDKYGRKALLTLPLVLAFTPHAILAYSRNKSFFYAFYLMKTLTSMLCEGSVNCLALAYVADTVPEGQRGSAFGLLSGIMSVAFVGGTVTARALSLKHTFQIAAVTSMVSAVYMRIFLKDTPCHTSSPLTLPILKTEPCDNSADGDSSNSRTAFKSIPSPGDLISFLKSSKTFSQAAVVAFFSSLTEGGFHASLLYFLRARFQFRKDQFADIMLIVGIASTVSQLFLMPFLVPTMGEYKLLSLGLLGASINIVLNSIAWSAWVPYMVAGSSIFVVFTTPCLRSIASKLVGPSEQGKAQGCLSGISSFANILSPLIFSPLTALFLSARAPFNFPGFSIMCIGLGSVIAFIQSLLMKATPVSEQEAQNDCTEC